MKGSAVRIRSAALRVCRAFSIRLRQAPCRKVRDGYILASSVGPPVGGEGGQLWRSRLFICEGRCIEPDHRRDVHGAPAAKHCRARFAARPSPFSQTRYDRDRSRADVPAAGGGGQARWAVDAGSDLSRNSAWRVAGRCVCARGCGIPREGSTSGSRGLRFAVSRRLSRCAPSRRGEREAKAACALQLCYFFRDPRRARALALSLDGRRVTRPIPMLPGPRFTDSRLTSCSGHRPRRSS